MSKFKITIPERKKILEESILHEATGIRYINMAVEVAKIQKERKDNGMSMLITIVPKNPSAYKDPNRTVTICKDPMTGVIFGVKKGEYKDGNIIWRKMLLLENLSLNLIKEADCQAYIIFRMHDWFEGAPFKSEMHHDPEYKIYDEEEDAKLKEDKFEEMEKSMARAKSLSAENLIKFGRYLALSFDETDSIGVIRGKVKEMAMNNAFAFNQKWDSNSRTVEEIFASASSIGLIKQSSAGYKFEGYTLGMTEPESKTFLSKKSDLLALIATAISEQDILLNKVMSEEKKETSKPKGKATTTSNKKTKIVDESIEEEETVVEDNDEF